MCRMCGGGDFHECPRWSGSVCQECEGDYDDDEFMDYDEEEVDE